MQKRVAVLAMLIVLPMIFASCSHSEETPNVSSRMSANISDNTTSVYSSHPIDSTIVQSEEESYTYSVESEEDAIESLGDIQINEISVEKGDRDYYWSAEGVKETLNFCINNTLWYHGEYSEWYDLIGNTYEVINIQVMEKGPEDYMNLSFLFPTKLDFPCDNVIYVVEGAPSGYSEPIMFNEGVRTESFDTEEDLISFVKSEVSTLDENQNSVYRLPTYKYTVSKPVKPTYVETDNKDKEKEKIENKICEQLKEDGIKGNATAYIKDFVVYDIGYKSLDVWINGETDVFVEADDGNVYWYHYYAEYDGSDIDDYDSVGCFGDVEKVVRDEDQYYFNQVKETTDIVFSFEV